MKTRIKVCGFTQAKNAHDAALLGLDAIGLVFYDKSPRYIKVQTALEIVNALPPFINRVGLFVNADAGFIDKVLCEVPLDTLQFHGNESADECEQYGVPYIKSVAMNGQTNLAKTADAYHLASGLLLDTPSKKFGGTGEVFNWALVNNIQKPIILAGGLTPDSVADAIRQVRPYAVDVSSGVESQLGIKNIAKIESFIKEVKNG